MLQVENKKLVLAGIVAAIMLTGCGKKTPTTTAAPVLLDDAGGADVPTTTPQNLEETTPSYPTEDAPVDALPVEDAPTGGSDADADADEDEDAEDAAAKAEAEAKKKAEAEAAAKAAAEAAAKAAAEAAEKAEEEAARRAEEKRKKAEKEAQEKAEKLLEMTPKFKKAIGEGSLHAAMGIAVANDILYVVDNARQGLLGKFAAVRSYDVATGDFLSSVENIGWAGAKNLPTTVTRVKIDGGAIVAADATSTYKFSLLGELLESAEATFALPTEVEVSDDLTYKLKDGHVERYDDDDDKVLEFGEDELEDPVSIAVDSKGNIYVSERSTPKVVVFSAPED